MKMKTAVVALILVLSPGLAFATCRSFHQISASACPEGQIRDASSGICILPVSS